MAGPPIGISLNDLLGGGRAGRCLLIPPPNECIASDTLNLNEVAEDIDRLATKRGVAVEFG